MYHIQAQPTIITLNYGLLGYTVFNFSAPLHREYGRSDGTTSDAAVFEAAHLSGSEVPRRQVLHQHKLHLVPWLQLRRVQQHAHACKGQTSLLLWLVLSFQLNDSGRLSGGS